MRIKYYPNKGIKILDVKLNWGVSKSVARNILGVSFESSEIGNRFSQGISFDNYSKIDINGTIAEGYDFQLGYDENNSLIEFSIIWDFELEILDFNLNYCDDFEKVKSILIKNKFEIETIKDEILFVKQLKMKLAKSSIQKTTWNKGKLFEYFYASK